VTECITWMLPQQCSQLISSHVNCQVLAKKERRLVAAVTSAEKGENLHIVLAPRGSICAPMLVFPHKRIKAELVDGAPGDQQLFYLFTLKNVKQGSRLN
jgi:hypothetical protein